MTDSRLHKFTYARNSLSAFHFWIVYGPDGREFAASMIEREARDLALSFNESLSRHGKR